MTFRTLAVVLATSLALAACPPPEQGSEGEGEGEPAAPFGGVVLVQEAVAYSATAAFHAPVADPRCDAGEVFGACTFFTCDPTAAPAAAPASADGGLVSVTGGVTDVELAFAADAYDVVTGSEGLLFDNGNELEITSAGGADLGAFAVTVVAPTPLRLTDPPLSSVTVKVTNALAVAWTGASAGDVRVTLTETPSAARVATCSAPVSDGALSIPLEVIGRFPIGTGNLTAQIASTASVDVDDTHAVSAQAIVPATSAVGERASYNVFFEAP